MNRFLDIVKYRLLNCSKKNVLYLLFISLPLILQAMDNRKIGYGDFNASSASDSASAGQLNRLQLMQDEEQGSFILVSSELDEYNKKCSDSIKSNEWCIEKTIERKNDLITTNKKELGFVFTTGNVASENIAKYQAEIEKLIKSIINHDVKIDRSLIKLPNDLATVDEVINKKATLEALKTNPIFNDNNIISNDLFNISFTFIKPILQKTPTISVNEMQQQLLNAIHFYQSPRANYMKRLYPQYIPFLVFETQN